MRLLTNIIAATVLLLSLAGCASSYSGDQPYRYGYGYGYGYPYHLYPCWPAQPNCSDHGKHCDPNPARDCSNDIHAPAALSASRAASASHTMSSSRGFSGASSSGFHGGGGGHGR